MRICSVGFCGTLALTLFLGALSAAASPRIYSPTPNFDFGERDNSSDVEYDFVVMNVGTEPLEITNVKTTCGCTVAEPQDKMLDPGEETVISAKFSLRGRQGDQRRPITVSSNDPANPTYTLQFLGSAVAAIAIEPQMVNFGRITDPADVEPVRVTFRATKPDLEFSVTGVEGTRGTGDFVTRVEEIEAGREYAITVSPPSAAEPGTKGERFAVRTDNSDYPTLFLNAFAQVLGPIEVAPRSITINVTGAETSPATQFVQLQPGTVQEFNVTEVVAPLEEIQTEIIPQRAQGIVNVKLTNVPRDERMENTELVIRTDSAEMPEVRVPFTLYRLPAPAASNPPPAQPAPAAAS